MLSSKGFKLPNILSPPRQKTLSMEEEKLEYNSILEPTPETQLYL